MSSRSSVNLFTAIVLTVALCACHTSKKATYTTTEYRQPSKRTYAQMRDDATSRVYDIPKITELIYEASQWLGTPYVLGGQTCRKGTDCSGLTLEVFKKVLGAKLPRTAAQQSDYCTRVRPTDLLPGDLVFFATGSNPKKVTHVALYIGNGDFIHSSSTLGVIISNINERYYATRLLHGGRTSHTERLYAEAAKRQPSTPPATEITVTPTLEPIITTQIEPVNAPEPTPDDIIKAQIEAAFQAQLDSIITEKIDSIYNPAFFD